MIIRFSLELRRLIELLTWMNLCLLAWSNYIDSFLWLEVKIWVCFYNRKESIFFLKVLLYLTLNRLQKHSFNPTTFPNLLSFNFHNMFSQLSAIFWCIASHSPALNFVINASIDFCYQYYTGNFPPSQPIKLLLTLPRMSAKTKWTLFPEEQRNCCCCQDVKLWA